MKNARTALLALMLVMPAAFTPALADEPVPDDIKALLKAQTGKSATVQMRSGQELTGTVVFVGDEMVRLSRLSGKDFYDAAIKLDDVSAVVFKARQQ